MEIAISQEQGRVAVSVIRIVGHLDGQTYQDLIAKAREVVKAGTKNILLDLSDLTYISSAGLVSLHTIALMTRGEEPPDPEQGWSTLKSMEARVTAAYKSISNCSTRAPRSQTFWKWSASLSSLKYSQTNKKPLTFLAQVDL